MLKQEMLKQVQHDRLDPRIVALNLFQGLTMLKTRDAEINAETRDAETSSA
ncbi:MAG TPA: hypothetical protein VFM82_04790 [Flavobacteriaceae bacterium]|nr:hypothetical protein [Flavobacteriaceae bacterium]